MLELSGGLELWSSSEGSNSGGLSRAGTLELGGGLELLSPLDGWISGGLLRDLVELVEGSNLAVC